MNRRREKRVSAGREKSPSFTKITRQMNQQLWRANNRYIYLKNRWKRLHIFGKSSFLYLEPSTMIQTSCNFSPLLNDFRTQKYSSMFGFPWKNPSVNFQCISKKKERKMMLWHGLDSRFQLLTSSTLQGLFRVFRIRFCFMRVSWHVNQKEMVSNAHVPQLTMSAFDSKAYRYKNYLYI